ncbi:hypothetical protein SEA1_gp0024 [Salmonella phage SEA1]|nr:hypothetical protein SEA1_gp0024 [Salmonella phage SEA1]
MNYKRIYDSLIKRAQLRALDCYKESHHIIPTCIGGPDTKENQVYLTAEEHYLAHQLLVKIYPGKGKLIFAANMMTVDAWGGRSKNKTYSWLKKKWVEELKTAMTRRKMPEEFKKAQSERHTGTGNPMYGVKGKDHPVFGLPPWRMQTTLNKEDYKYSYLAFDWLKINIKKGYYKKSEYKRFCKELSINPTGNVLRHIFKKLKEGWNPYKDSDLKLWISEKGYNLPEFDLSILDYPKEYLYAYEIFDWVKSIELKGFKKAGYTRLNKDKNYFSIPDINKSQIINCLNSVNEGWNPYKDKKFLEWCYKYSCNQQRRIT